MRQLRKHRLFVLVALAVIVAMSVIGMIKGANATGTGELVQTVAAEAKTPEIAEDQMPVIYVQPMKAGSVSEEAPTPKAIEFEPSSEDVEMLAKLVWGEARGVDSTDQKAAVVWCVLNRVDSEQFPDTIAEVVTQRNQFSGYSESYPVTLELREIARDVLVRWHQEKDGAANVGRTLPSEYLFFVGDGVRNYFSIEWRSKDYFDWSLPSPYGK